jgi:hypothetical protein
VEADLQRADPYLARQLVRSAEIYLSMAGAKQLVTLGLSWFRPGPTSSRGVLGALYCGAPCACRGVLQARRERRLVLQVPEILIEASANIVVKAESV